MKISLNWLREYVDFDWSAEELAEKLLLSGTAVETIHKQGAGVKDVVVGEILQIIPHPKADRLQLCQVTEGKREYSVVCGATNMKAQDRVAFAQPDAELPGFKIAIREIRGVVSEGMLCSEVELGIGEEASGIMILPPDAPLGEQITDYLGIEDAVLELEITPNRPDCMSMIGVAREVAALAGTTLKRPSVDLKEDSESGEALAEIKVEDTELCPRYSARIIKDIEIAPSPLWMQLRLRAAGFRPINNVVDITNYVLLETGQPLHAFDYELVRGGRIIVRRAAKGEKMTTLDGAERSLFDTDLVIADANSSVALAGVMGGGSSEVSENTKTVLLESAYFKPQSVMDTSRRLGLITESSQRFERGVDPNGVSVASDRAAQLMSEHASGRVLKNKVDVYPTPIKEAELALRPDRVNKLLGTALETEEMKNILESLQIPVSASGENLLAKAPTFRRDLEREIDLIEEIARMHGYQNIPSTLPGGRLRIGGLSATQKLERKIRELLVGAGFSEALNFSFTGVEKLDRLSLPQEHTWRKTVNLVNPLGSDTASMRPTLLTGLLDTAELNVSRGNHSLRLFEIGVIFQVMEDKSEPQENLSLALLLTGSSREKTWFSGEEAADFYEIKGMLEAILSALGLQTLAFPAAEVSFLQKGMQASIKTADVEVGFMGKLIRNAAESWDLEKPVYVAELDLNKVLSMAQPQKHFQELPRYPGVHLDMAVIAGDAIPAGDIEDIIKQNGGDLLQEINLFDVYKGKPLPEEQKSLAYSLVFRSEDRTLTEEEAKKHWEKIVGALGAAGLQIRR